MLETIPASCLVEALSYISHKSAHLSWFRWLCPGVQAALADDSTWRHLCARYWYVTEERLRQWPTLSSQVLYRALEQWTPLEGFYVLAPAFPWGLLVLVRIEEGCLLADVLRFLPRGRSGEAALQHPSQCSDAFEEVRVPLFRGSLGEDRLGAVVSTLQAPWLPSSRTATVSDLLPEDIRAGTADAARFWGGRLDIVRQGVLAAHRALRVQVEEAAARQSDSSMPVEGEGPEDDLESRTAICSSREWQTGTLCVTVPEVVRQTAAMLQDMLGESEVPCDLALICSPEQFEAKNPELPRIRPGLYVGDYAHRMYGQYRTEVLLLEYVELTPAQLQAEALDPRMVFRRPQASRPPEELTRILELDACVTFVRGTKQCGDCHVPMGATTFVALCGPPEAAAMLAELSGQEAPRRIVNGQTGEQEQVVRAWRGWGTLAMMGFRGPSWSGGWLVQLQDSSATGDHRFGFAWDRDEEAIVLCWVVAQDSSPFLQRTWLPEDLR